MRPFVSSSDTVDLRNQLIAAQDEISSLHVRLGEQTSRRKRLEDDLRSAKARLDESRIREAKYDSEENVHPQLSSLKQALEEARKDNKLLREVCAGQKGNSATGSPRPGHRTVQISASSTLSANQKREVSEMITRLELLHAAEKERLEKERARIISENEAILLESQVSKDRQVSNHTDPRLVCTY
jgi:hypothetical protein